MSFFLFAARFPELTRSLLVQSRNASCNSWVENFGSRRNSVAGRSSILRFNGTIFSVLLLRSEVPELTDLALNSRIGEWNLDQVRQKTLIPHPGRRILFIDTLHHDPSVIESVEQLGLEITVVDTMEEACMLDQSQTGYFDTVLVDQLSIVERLRDVEHLRYIPLVLITPQIPQLNLKVRILCPRSQLTNRSQFPSTTVLPRLRCSKLCRIANKRARHV